MKCLFKYIPFIGFFFLILSCNPILKEEGSGDNNKKNNLQVVESYPSEIDSIVTVILKAKFYNTRITISEIKVFHPSVDEKVLSNEEIKEQRKYIDTNKFVVRVKIKIDNGKVKTETWIFLFDKNNKLEWYDKEDASVQIDV